MAKAVSQALNRCVNCLPGQRDVDNAIRTVGEASKTLLADSVSTTYKMKSENTTEGESVILSTCFVG